MAIFVYPKFFIPPPAGRGLGGGDILYHPTLALPFKGRELVLLLEVAKRNFRKLPLFQLKLQGQRVYREQGESPTKKQSWRVANEHFEEAFNAVICALTVPGYFLLL